MAVLGKAGTVPGTFLISEYNVYCRWTRWSVHTGSNGRTISSLMPYFTLKAFERRKKKRAIQLEEKSARLKGFYPFIVSFLYTIFYSKADKVTSMPSHHLSHLSLMPISFPGDSFS